MGGVSLPTPHAEGMALRALPVNHHEAALLLTPFPLRISVRLTTNRGIQRREVFDKNLESTLLLDLPDSRRQVLVHPCTAKRRSYERHATRLTLGQSEPSIVLNIEHLMSIMLCYEDRINLTVRAGGGRILNNVEYLLAWIRFLIQNIPKGQVCRCRGWQELLGRKALGSIKQELRRLLLRLHRRRQTEDKQCS